MDKMLAKPDEAQVVAYLLGVLPAKEVLAVERYAAAHADFAAELELRRNQVGDQAQRGAVNPPARLKKNLFASDALQDDPVGRDFPPYIHSKSQISDFMPWISDAMQQLAQSKEDFECIPVGASSDTYTFLARMCTTIPEEVHTVEVERVMLVEGKCDFVVGSEVFHFGPGDRYQIPLHVPHSARNTASTPCIFIVQRSFA